MCWNRKKHSWIILPSRVFKCLIVPYEWHIYILVFCWDSSFYDGTFIGISGFSFVGFQKSYISLILLFYLLTMSWGTYGTEASSPSSIGFPANTTLMVLVYTSLGMLLSLHTEREQIAPQSDHTNFTSEQS